MATQPDIKDKPLCSESKCISGETQRDNRFLAGQNFVGKIVFGRFIQVCLRKGTMKFGLEEALSEITQYGLNDLQKKKKLFS
ncbi:Hypothetical protein CINCED_3A025015 [Cinara cedri]|uniref:Uncharacterized protein n=1 Tax=Cinara cedri TaxID=506608 RepID=A0A5E4MK65_9HEMI|nr:Hypothetical protein CINCED_3A025015 [Cinara cedri]